jgi:SAM-dependent methyltransferase
MVREPDATMQPTPQQSTDVEARVLNFLPQLRLEWRGQDGQNQTEQPEHSASFGYSITSLTQIRFSVHTPRSNHASADKITTGEGMPNSKRLMIRILRFAARPLPAEMRDWARQVVETRLKSRLPDRAMLLEALFPALHQTSALSNNSKVLWIGCRPYTKLYYDLIEQKGAECWSVDIDPDMQPFGRSGRHITGDMLELRQLFPGNYFDTVLCNGVLGYGVDTPADQLKAFEAMAAVTKPDGRLLVGWNTDRMSDPLKFGLADRWFEHAPLPGFAARYVVDGCTHVYDTYRRLTRAQPSLTNTSTTLADHMKEFVENGDK